MKQLVFTLMLLLWFIGESSFGQERQPTQVPQEVIVNSEAAKASPAAAAAAADVGHVRTPAELAELVGKGEASRCAVITSPAGAEIETDGNKLGVSPLVFVLLKHGNTPRVVTIKMKGYKTAEKSFIPDGKTIPIGLTLEAEATSLEASRTNDLAPACSPTSTDCSCPSNKKDIDDIYNSRATNPRFLMALEDGTVRWLNATVENCKVSIWTTMQHSIKIENCSKDKDKLDGDYQCGITIPFNAPTDLIHYDELSKWVLIEKMRRGL
jgi:PEGA domain